MQPLLVTGFEPFGAHRVNPSEEVVRALAGRAGITAAVLPVSYRRAEERLLVLLAAGPPRALLMLGVAAGPALRLERVARNRDDALACDVDGETRAGRPISPAAPADYASTLPLDAFAEALADAALPVTWSDDAGGFLCNHIFFRACEWLEERTLGIPRGLVHLPPPDALALDRQLAAVASCLDVLGARVPAQRSGR